MSKVVRIEATAIVTQIYNTRPVMARYEVTKRGRGNYQIDLYADGDYVWQWNNANMSDEDYTYKKFSLALATEMMIQLASNPVIYTYDFIWM